MMRAAPACQQFRYLFFIIVLVAGLQVSWGQCPLPEGETLESCGRLETAGPFNCVVFRAGDGQIYRLPTLGGFAAGDRVFVRGTLSTFAGGCFGVSPPPRLLSCNTIERCFEECGELSDAGSPGCLRFIDNDGQAFAIQNPGAFQSGQRVFVTGFVGQTPTQCGPDLLPTLVNDSIEACVSDFGRLVIDQGTCTHFQTAAGVSYDIETTGAFSPGDFVFVEGAAQPGVTGFCGNPLLAPSTLTAGFGGTGVITETVECGVVLEAENTGQRKSRFVLSDLGEFGIGDRVFAAGTIDRENCPCTLTDPLGRDGCIDVEVIGEIFADCGMVEFGAGPCPTFTPDAGGGPYALEFLPINYFNFFTGKSFVSGVLMNESAQCGAGVPTIRFNYADPCQEGCGVFGQGFECNPLLAATSELAAGASNADILWVENRQGVPPVSAEFPAVVHVKGGLRPGTPVVICGFPSLRANLISNCAASPDVNGDSVVDLDDIALFVDVLLNVEFAPAAPNPASRMDFNQDFRLDGRDIQGFVNALFN